MKDKFYDTGPELLIYFDKRKNNYLSPNDIMFFGLVSMEIETHIKKHRLDEMFGANSKTKIIKN
jgi:hypothetical protein